MKHYPYKAKKVAPYVQLRRNKLYAVLELSAELRAKLGKPRLVRSLGTDDIGKARKLAREIVEAWKAEIAIAKNEPDSAARHRIELAKAKTAGDDAGLQKAMDAIELEAENIGHSWSPADPRNASPTEIAAIENAAHERGQDFFDRATGKRIKLADHIEDWLKASDYTPRIMNEARAVVTKFCTVNKEVADFSRFTLQRYVNKLETSKAPDTVKKHLSYVRKFWLYLQKHDKAPYEVDPFQGVQRKSRKAVAENGDGKRQNFTKADINKLLNASKGTTLHGLIELAAYTGCRIEELCSLKLADVHDRAEIPYVHIAKGKTQNATRDVPIHKAILPLVRIMKHGSKDGYLVSGLSVPDDLRRSSYMVRKFSKLKTGLGYGPEHTFHSIRHTVITELDEAEVFPNYLIQRRLIFTCGVTWGWARRSYPADDAGKEAPYVDSKR
jgi:integrase